MVPRQLGLCCINIFFPMVSVLHAHASPKSPAVISYTDIAKMPENGLNFRYAGLRNDTLLNAFDIFSESVVRAVPVRLPPMFSTPGVAVLDFDNDGDLDVYVNNGNLERFGSAAPQASNALYANQLSETGQLRFVDVTSFSGIAATGHDSTGVCVADTLKSLEKGVIDRQFRNRLVASAIAARHKYDTSARH